MATLKLIIDSSGAEDGGRRFSQIAKSISQEAVEADKRVYALRAALDSVGQAATANAAAIKAYDSALAVSNAKTQLKSRLLSDNIEKTQQLTAVTNRAAQAAEKEAAAQAKLNEQLRLRHNFGAGVLSPLSSGGIGPRPFGYGVQSQKTAYPISPIISSGGLSGGSSGLSLKDIEGALRNTGKAAGETSGSFLNLKKSWIGYASQLGLGLTAIYAIRRGLTETIGTISEYEKQLSILQAVTHASAGEQKRLADTARSAGINGMFSATESAAALVELAKAGFSAEEAISALNGVMAFSINAQVSVAQAADITAKIIRQFNLEAADAVQVMDSLTSVANKTTTTVENLANAFKFVGPVANALGLDVQTTSAALGVLAQGGIEASLAGTSLRRILLELASITPEARKQLEAMSKGLSDRVNPATHSLVEILKELNSAYLTSAAARKIFDQRSVSAALILTNRADELGRLLELEKEEEGVALRNAAIISDNLAGAWTKLGNTIKEVSLEAGDSGALGLMRSAIDNLNAGILLLTGNWRKIRSPDTDEAVFQLRDLLDALHDGTDSDSAKGIGDALEKAKAKIKSFEDYVKAAKDGVSFDLKSMQGIDILQGSAYLKERSKDFQFQTTEGTLPITFSKDEAVKAIDEILASLQAAIDSGKPLVIKKIAPIDFSVFENISDTALENQADNLQHVIEGIQEQRKALKDSTADLRAQNTVRSEETKILIENKRVAKELAKAQQDLIDANPERKAEIEQKKQELILQLANNDAKKKYLDTLREEAYLLDIDKQVKAASARFEDRMKNNAISQAAHKSDLEAELAGLRISNDYREESIRLANQRTDAEKEYAQTVSEIHGSDMEQHEKYDRATEAMKERIAVNEQLTRSIIKQQRVERLATGMSDSFGNAFEEIIMGTESVSKAFENMMRSIEQQLLHELATRPLTNALFGLFSSSLGGMGIFGGTSNGLRPGESGPPSSAYGNAFASGGVISRLGRIPTNRGMGIVGEQGPEGILPLARDSDGRLGVRMIGQDMPNMQQAGQSTTVNKTANVTVYAKDVDSFKRTQKQISSDLRRKM